jgi:hypothetical protein
MDLDALTPEEFEATTAAFVGWFARVEARGPVVYEGSANATIPFRIASRSAAAFVAFVRRHDATRTMRVWCARPPRREARRHRPGSGTRRRSCATRGSPARSGDDADPDPDRLAAAGGLRSWGWA